MFRRFFGERRQTQSGREGRDTAPSSNVVRVMRPTLALRLPPLAWKMRKNNARSAGSSYLSWPEFYSPANRWVRGRWLKSHCLPVGWLDILNNKTQHSLNNQNPIPPRHTDPTLHFPASFRCFTIFPQSFRKIPVIQVTTFRVVPVEISGSKRRSEKVILFSRSEYTVFQTESSSSTSSNPSVIPVSGVRARFSINGTGLCKC